MSLLPFLGKVLGGNRWIMERKFVSRIIVRFSNTPLEMLLSLLFLLKNLKVSAMIDGHGN